MPGSSSLVRQQLVIATVAAFLLLSAAKGHCSLDAKWNHKNAFQLRESGPNLRWCCGISGRKNGPRH
jgi:hypothetical protein